MPEDLQGPRRAALATRKVRRRRRVAFVAALLVVVFGSAAALSLGLDEQPQVPGPDHSGDVAEVGRDRISTTLLFGTRQDAAEEGAVWLTLISVNESDGRASIVYVPAHTATEIPARGLHPVGGALATGGVPLLVLSAENLLGVGIDRYVELSEQDARVLFQEVGALDVNVPLDVKVAAGANEARILFPQGPQRLGPEALADLLFTRALDGDDVELGNRHLAFWDALLRTYRGDADALEAAVEGAGGALSESDAPVEENARFFGSLAALGDSGINLALLPVRPVGVGGHELYAADTEELGVFLEQALGAELLVDDEVNVQILNGNGYPGIGQRVAQRLVGEGFRIILSGNARTLDYERTLVIVYEATEENLALARRARELIGLGKVQVAAQRQGIVDLTIVVGKDFLRAR